MLFAHNDKNRVSKMDKNTLKAVLLLVIATMCWGGNITLGRAISADVPPFGLTFWRWTIVTTLLIAFNFALFRRQRHLLRAHWKLIALVALTGVCIYPAFQFYALRNTSAINAALFVAISPVIVPILATWLLGTKVRALEIFGIAISTVGILVVICRGDLQTLLKLSFSWGDLLMLFCTFCWSAYTVLLKRVPADIAPMMLFASTTALAALFVLPLYTWEATFVRPITLSGLTLFSLGYTTIFASLIGYFCFGLGVKALGPNTSGLFIHLIPIFTTIFAIVLLGESLHTFHLFGVAAIASGLVLSTWAAQRSVQAPTTQPVEQK